MSSSTVEVPLKGRGARGGGRGGRGRGRGGPPGRGRGGGKTNQDERGEPEPARQNGPLDAVSKMNNTKKVEGIAGRYGFIPAANPHVGLGGSAPIGQGANRGFVPHGRGGGAPPPSMRIPPGFYAPTIPAPVGIPFNGVLQGAPDQPSPVPAQAAPCAQVTIPSPINVQGVPNGYGGQNGGRGRGFRGGWFKGANSGRENDNRSDNGDARGQASNDSRGGRGWRGGYAPRGGFRGRGRGNFEGSDRGGRGRGQSWRGGRGGRGGTGPRGDRTSGERRPPREPVVDNLPPARDMRENVVGPAIVELTAPDVAIANKPTNIEDFHCIGSYTWAKERRPTLIVPGSPREWLDRTMPFKVNFDSGIRMFHEDAFYMANESTLIPLFRAVDAMALGTESEPSASDSAEAIDWAAVDFVTDRNNLRKLLRWIREPGPTETTHVSSPTGETSPVSPTSDGSEGKQGSDAVAGAALEWDPRKDFRIDLQLGGENAVLMQRWAARAREVIAPPKGGCRSNFEREHTTAARGCENGAGHYRIVQYNIGGLNMVVRFEVDACISATTTAAAGPEKELERDASPGSSLPEYNVRGAEVATPSHPVSDIATIESVKALAQQSFNNENEEALWGGGSTAEDWGVVEEPPAPQPSPHDESEAKQPETEEVDFEREATLWAGGGDDSWGAPPEPPRSSKGEHVGSKGKADVHDPAPPPEDFGWDFPEDDAAAWGFTTDTAQNEDSPGVNGELTIVRSGTLLPQSSIIELATRSIRFADRTSNEDTFLQLFLTRTPTHLVAIHQNGNFEKVVRQELESVEFTSIAEMEGIQKGIAQFVELLKEIQRLVKEHGTSGRLSLVCEKGKLELFGLGGEEGRLSDGELERFKTSA